MGPEGEVSGDSEQEWRTEGQRKGSVAGRKCDRGWPMLPYLDQYPVLGWTNTHPVIVIVS